VLIEEIMHVLISALFLLSQGLDKKGRVENKRKRGKDSKRETSEKTLNCINIP
jgi:hypothetical protein